MSPSPSPSTPAASEAAAVAPPATFTLDHYEHMVACGAFAGEYEKRIELLWGRIVEMTPPGPPHCDEVDFLNKWSFLATAGQPIRVRVQQPIRLPSSNSGPEPDICWVKEQSYAKRHPNPEEVLLAIEVAESSLPKDRGPKLAAYAEAGIADYWIINLAEEQVEVYRTPTGVEYTEQVVLRSGQSVTPMALPTASLSVQDLFDFKA